MATLDSLSLHSMSPARASRLRKVDDLLDRHTGSLCAVVAFLLPLKLSFAFVILIPLIFLWLVRSRGKVAMFFDGAEPLAAPFLIFVSIAVVTSIFGLDPLRSFRNVGSLIFFSATICVFSFGARTPSLLRILGALIAGQSIAAIHSVIEGAFPESVPKIFIGKVTESGQLGLTILVAMGVLAYLESEAIANRLRPKHTLDILLGALNFAFLSLFSFSSEVQALQPFVPIGYVLTAATFFTALIRSCLQLKTDSHEGARRIIFTVALPLLVAALMVNLKRGPWAGVLVSSILLFLLVARRVAIPAVILFALLSLTLTPVRDRITQSSDHFFISGGRSVMWEIGAELSMRYPLGIGYKNSPFLQKFSDEIPPELKHFHNNALNVLVETGWLGLAAYLWWTVAVLKLAFSTSTRDRSFMLARAIGCAILSWQIGGLVEYNFGDSEVVLVALLLVGTLNGIAINLRATVAPPVKEGSTRRASPSVPHDLHESEKWAGSGV